MLTNLTKQLVSIHAVLRLRTFCQKGKGRKGGVERGSRREGEIGMRREIGMGRGMGMGEEGWGDDRRGGWERRDGRGEMGEGRGEIGEGR